MTERDKAWADRRRDIIDEVHAANRSASAAEVVRAIVTRLSQPIPELIEVEIEVQS